MTLLPADFDGLDLQSIHLEQTGDLLWDASARYGDPDDEDSQEPPETGEPVISFDTPDGAQHITQSFQTQKHGDNAPDFGGATGVTDDSVEGVDITIPALRFSGTRASSTLRP